MLRKWEELPEYMQINEVRAYYDILSYKKASLLIKRIFDFIVALILLIIISPILFVLALLIVLDSPGGVFYRQIRITQYGKEFRIHKFRTMVSNADKMGSLVTVGEDVRVTKIGRFLRKYRLDELPQLIDILQGNMSFVGTRPEVPKYVNEYSAEMKATLLLPAGVTSEASIFYKDEAKLLDGAEDVDRVYVEQVLPGKMKYNLESIKNFGFWGEIRTMVRT
ncbi:MAG: sugar transferase, partial [Agathobacter sp.]|nr:sugar transferase [Agathobacter sp.]